MRRVRLAQQEAAHKRALEAAKEHKEKEREIKHKKNVSVAHSKTKGGDRLGKDNGYNPMQPFSGNTQGYRPARKSVRRG